MMRTAASIVAMIVLWIVGASGCSVGMAMSGERSPNVGVLKIGQDRSIVLLNLGQPSLTKATENGRVDIFHLQRGNDPSVGRAVGHAVMDVLTFGGWELIGTPIEGFAGEDFSITVTYDSAEKVIDISSAEGESAF